MRKVSSRTCVALLAAALALSACRNDGANPAVTDDRSVNNAVPGTGAGNSATGATGGTATSPGANGGQNPVAATPGTSGAPTARGGVTGQDTASGRPPTRRERRSPDNIQALPSRADTAAL